MPRQVAGPSFGVSSSSNFGEQARSLDELAILSLLFSFRVKHNLWSLMLSGISRPSGSRSESGSLDGGLALGVVSLRVRVSHLNLKFV